MDDRSDELVAEGTAAMLEVFQRVRSGEIEIRNGREAGDFLKAAMPVVQLAKGGPTAIEGRSREELQLEALQLVAQIEQRKEAMAGIGQPTRPAIETTVMDTPLP